MDIIHTSIGEGYAQRFYKLCRKNGISEREFIENLVDDYYNSRFEIRNGHIEQELPFNEEFCDGDCESCFMEDDDVDLSAPDDLAHKMLDAIMGVLNGAE